MDTCRHQNAVRIMGGFFCPDCGKYVEVKQLKPIPTPLPDPIRPPVEKLKAEPKKKKKASKSE